MCSVTMISAQVASIEESIKGSSLVGCDRSELWKGVEFSSLIDAKKKVCRVSINISYSTVQ